MKISDLVITAWSFLFVGTLAGLAAFLVAYSMFGHVVLGGIAYFAYAFYAVGLSFLVLTAWVCR